MKDPFFDDENYVSIDTLVSDTSVGKVRITPANVERTKIDVKSKRIGSVDVPIEIINMLEGKGYTLTKEIGKGEGHTRDVFLATHVSGEHTSQRVVKIPKKIDFTSLYLLLNTSRKNIHVNEARVSGQISHPNISGIMEHIPFDGLDIIVEDYFDSQSLKRYSSWSPMTDYRKIYSIFSQVAKGLNYLHRNGICHKDVKSSNILVGVDGFVKLTDLQNAGSSGDLEDKFLPTRGDSSHTHPHLINAVLRNEKASARANNDIYGFGATLYETYTGRIPLDIKLALSKTGKSILIGNVEFHADLILDGQSIDAIVDKVHEVKLNGALKEIPNKLRNIIYRCMTTSDKAYKSLDEVIVDLEGLQRPDRNKWLNKLYDSFKPIAITATTVGTIGLLTWFGITHPQKDNEPSQLDMLMKRNYMEWSTDSLSVFDNDAMWSTLHESIDDAKECISYLDNFKKSNPIYPSIGEFVDFGYNMHGVDYRLMSGLLHSVCATDTAKVNRFYQGKRRGVTFVPRDFIVRTALDTYVNANDEMDYRQQIVASVLYMKGCIGQSKDVADVYARYFCTQSEIFSAQMRSKSTNYFARLDSNSTVREGYSQYLSSIQRQLIENAVLFYKVTSDKQGKLDWNLVPKMMIRGAIGTSREYQAWRVVPPDEKMLKLF